MMTRHAALAFAQTWADNWNRLDVDAVVNHFAADGEMTSPLAARLTGNPQVRGREAIRAYWHEAYGRVTAPRLTLEAVAWDEVLQRLIVWWRAELPGGVTRACELMDFDAAGAVRRSEAYYGAPTA